MHQKKLKKEKAAKKIITNLHASIEKFKMDKPKSEEAEMKAEKAATLLNNNKG